MRESFPEKSSKAPQLRRLREPNAPGLKTGVHQRETSIKRNVRFNSRISIKPISIHSRESKTTRSRLWYNRDELHQMRRDRRSITKSLPLDDKIYEEGGFFLHLYGMGTENNRRKKFRRVVNAVHAVLKEQSRQQKQNGWNVGAKQRDLTPMFMIALQYSWHTSEAQETANIRAVQQRQEIEKVLARGDDIFNDDDSELLSAGGVVDLLHAASGHDACVPTDDFKVKDPKLSLTASMSDDEYRRFVFKQLQSSAKTQKIGQLQDQQTCRATGDSTLENVRFPSAPLPLTSMGEKLRTDILRGGAKLKKKNLCLRSSTREESLDPAHLRAQFKESIKKLINLNRFFHQIHGKAAMDRVHGVDMKSFRGTKRHSLLKDIQIPDDIEDTHDSEGEEKKDAWRDSKDLKSILLTREIKKARTKQNISWTEKLYRVTYIPVFPESAERTDYFYTSEEITKFRFEKFMEENGDEFEEVSEDEGDDDEDEYEYDEISYDSDEEDEYYEEEVVVASFESLAHARSALLGGTKRSSL